MAPSEEDRPLTWMLEDLPPTARQTRSAILVAAIAILSFLAVAPFSAVPLVELNAFFPSLNAIVFVTDLVTAILLYAQFSISRSRSLLVLATGYLFTAIIVIPHSLTFAGAFSAAGLLGANIQTGSWLFIFWHLGFAAALLGYAVLKDRKPEDANSGPSVLSTIGWTTVAVIVLVCALTWLATAGSTLLPPIILDKTRLSPIVIYPVSFVILICAAAFVILFSRRRSVLDQWLMVVSVVFIGELVFSGLLPSVRFSIGFYAGRIFSIITSSIVLVVLLIETTRLYVRLARLNETLRREQSNKLMNLEAVVSAIAHEVRQPLTGVTSSGRAALRFLRQQPLELERIESVVERMVEASYRTSQVFDNVRELFGRTEATRSEIDLNSLIVEVLRNFDTELEMQKIETVVVMAPALPPIMGNRGQLQEVIINLVQNAMEAMTAVNGPRRLKIKTVPIESGAIAIEIEDTGSGFTEEHDGKTIFEPFVTTKPRGMGLGLSICRMIVERHQGQLTASASRPQGAIFRIVLPQSEVHQDRSSNL